VKKSALFRYVAIAALGGTFGLGCAVFEPPVARTVDGVTTEGRFIEPEAYALYAVAALREARGQWREALTLYEQALELDSRGPELRTRIGAVACKLRRDSLANKAFASAERADPEYGPLWYELAQCRRIRGDLEAAQQAALRAVSLDPERFETSLLAADLADKRGDPSLAWRLRDALATHAPDVPFVQRNILAAARKAGDAARAARAQAAIDGFGAERSRAPALDLESALDALKAGDLSAARERADKLLGADPSNGSALVVALAVADLEQDHPRFARLLAEAEEPGLPVSPELLDTLSRIVARRVSAQAAQLLVP